MHSSTGRDNQKSKTHLLDIRFLRLLAGLLLITTTGFSQETAPGAEGLAVIPYPKEVKTGGNDFVFPAEIAIVLDRHAPAEDIFAAQELIRCLDSCFHQKSSIRNVHGAEPFILLSRKASGNYKSPEGYRLLANGQSVRIESPSAAGIFYGVQTLVQLIRQSQDRLLIKGIDVLDWPDTKFRAIHYDTKYHQDKKSYVEAFIRTLAKYKINMLVWEWEDKFAYPSHPEIGAPGAFTMQEMQAFTAYAKQYHIQIVPLVQGLGHVSFILKWPQYSALREIPASNFEFCPLKPGSYQLLADLWKDAIRATPGSDFIHIGSDETFELGQCPDCQRQAATLGSSGLYHLFVANAVKQLQGTDRKIMIWESPMHWAKGKNAGKDINPPKGLVLTEEYDFETPDLSNAKQAAALGYPVFAYDPNPGIEPLFLPYFFRKKEDGVRVTGSLENSYNFLHARLGKGVFEGMIRTSWDDSGLPIQCWMLSFVTAAAYSWNAAQPSLPEFTRTYFRNYYGDSASQVDRLFQLLNEAAYFYYESFERQVWHYGPIGKTTLPDLPRGDDLEYDPYWNIRYAEKVRQSREFVEKMNEALAICQSNLSRQLYNSHDFELFASIAKLVRHTALTYLDLSALETTIGQAQEDRFLSHEATFRDLGKAAQIVADNLARRDSVFRELVGIWEQTRLPKGMAAGGRTYFFRQDRTRHFANRTAGLDYLILDEQELGLEDWLTRLREYIKTYHHIFMEPAGESTISWPAGDQ